MTDPTYKLRVSSSGQPLKGTPGNVLTFGADGESVSGKPGGGSIPLPIPVSDLDALGIPNGWVLTATGGVAHWAPPAVGPTVFQITAFSYLGPHPQVGETISQPDFSATYSEPATSAFLSDTEGNNDPITLPATTFASAHDFTKTALGESVTFTDNASGASGSASASVTLTWGEYVRYGSAPDPGVYDEAFIEGLPVGALVVTPQGNYVYDAGPADFAFFTALSSYGLTPANFIQGVFPFACSLVAAGVSITNTFGIVEAMDVFRSDNPGLGPFTLGVI